MAGGSRTTQETQRRAETKGQKTAYYKTITKGHKNKTKSEHRVYSHPSIVQSTRFGTRVPQSTYYTLLLHSGGTWVPTLVWPKQPGLVPGYSRVYIIPYYYTLGVPGYLPEYDQSNQVWYPGTPEYRLHPRNILWGYLGTYPSMTQATRFGTRVLQSIYCTLLIYSGGTWVPTPVWPNQPCFVLGYPRVGTRVCPEYIP